MKHPLKQKLWRRRKFLTLGSKNGNKGFTFTEIIFAVTIFALFIAAYVTTEGQNSSKSLSAREELTLHVLAQQVMNEVILDPPQLRKELTLDPRTEKFESEGNENYEYTIEYSEFTLPNFQGLTGEEENSTQETSEQSALFRRVYSEVSKFVSKKIWQVEVTIRNTETDFAYSLTSWLSDPEAKAELRF